MDDFRSLKLERILLEEADNNVLNVTLNRPEQLNAVDWEMHGEIVSLYAALCASHNLGAVVITGAGRAFCAGGDLEHISRGRTDANVRSAQLAESVRLVREALSIRCPVIAAVNGPAVGLGATIALLADIVVMAESAFLSDPHTQVGLVAGDGGTILWPLLIGPSRAKEFLMLGSRIGANQAYDLGLVNHVVADDEVQARAQEIANHLALGPREAITGTKLAVNAQLLRAVGEGMPLAISLEGLSWVHDDIVEGVAATREKRVPTWPSTQGAEVS